MPWLSLLKNFVLQMDGLKKISAAIAGVIVAFALRYGVQLDPVSVATVISPIIAYIVGQGIADTSKPIVVKPDQPSRPMVFSSKDEK